METAHPTTARRSLGRSAFAFVLVGLVLYAVLYYAAEQLMRSTGRSNPFFKIATLEQPAVDWVVLGASHAMPLDFDGFNAKMEQRTGLRILNLASPGTGPLYNRFVLEHFLLDHRTRNVLYVVDSFAFYSRAWNEDRFADAKLLARTPRDPRIAARLLNYVRTEAVAPHALLDYATGFSKINNRDRFRDDKWEGEAQFERTWRPSSSAVKKRIDYLYPDGTPPAVLDRYLGEFSQLVDVARQAGAKVVVIKLPTPPTYRAQLPAETAFDADLLRIAAQAGVRVHDFSGAASDPRLYFDTDHLNRAGLNEFFDSQLKNLLKGDAPPPA
jgi:hypothetical protein